MKTIIFAIALFFTILVSNTTDYLRCMRECQNHGFPVWYCEEMCDPLK
jgi:hypothetical protein